MMITSKAVNRRRIDKIKGPKDIQRPTKQSLNRK
jgi:hypothetical protein